jgi:hypothetical protein
MRFIPPKEVKKAIGPIKTLGYAEGRMLRYLWCLLASLGVLGVLPMIALAAEPVSLSVDAYKPDLGVLIVQVNWGRSWKCGQFANAQLQALLFTKSPVDTPIPVSLDLETPSKLFVDNKFLPYAFIIQPGEYVLTGFDVKVARSIRDVSHIRGSKDNLIKEAKSVGVHLQ